MLPLLCDTFKKKYRFVLASKHQGLTVLIVFSGCTAIGEMFLYDVIFKNIFRRSDFFSLKH